MREHKEGFDALAQRRIEDLTNNYAGINQTLLYYLKKFRRSPSSDVIEQILGMEEFSQFSSMFMSTTGYLSQMTMQYLKDISMMLAIVSAVREGDIFKHLQAEREMLKLVFAFDHVHYARYNTYQHVLLSSMQRNNEDGFKDLSIYGHGSTSTGLPFSAIHGDLVTEHFNRETKGTAGPFRSGFSTDLRALNRWIKTSHIHSKLRVAVKKKFRLYTSSTHK